MPPGGSIEEIIAAANAEQPEPAPVENKRSVVRPEGKPMGKPVPKLIFAPGRLAVSLLLMGAGALLARHFNQARAR